MLWSFKKKPYSLSVLFDDFSVIPSYIFSFFRREYLETECHIYSCVLPLKMVYSILSILSQFAERLSSDSIIIYYFYLLLSYRLFSFHLIDSFQWLLYHVVITMSFEASRRDKNGSLQFWTILWISCQNETLQYLSGCSPRSFCDIHEQSKRSKSELLSTS